MLTGNCACLAGKYTCTAENGLGKVGEQDIILDVLYAPIVTLEAKTKEAEEGESVFIKCNVTANPKPVTIEWVSFCWIPNIKTLLEKL